YNATESLPTALRLPEPSTCHPERSEQSERSRRTEHALLTLCERLENFPRHMGIHSGGMVLTRDPLVRVAPVEWATMRDRTIIQWDKDDLQELGLIKIDLLGLGMLSLLREAFTLHQRCHGTELALHTIPADDPPTYEMIQKADTVGVFQIESRAQQSMLPRMKPACFYDIVMQVAIIRPGPIQGQMVHPFLRRRAGLERVTYPHPKLKSVLERTMGVPLFQEQGMRMAIEAAGFSPGEADQLRRAMGHKRSRKRMLEIYPRLVDGMVANGIDRNAAEQLFHMLEGFADYGFPESHAASFALLAYASSYVKCRFPAIFAAAILNVQPMGFYSTEVLVNDARRHHVAVKPVEVNASEYWSHVDASGALRLGFHLIRGLGEAQRHRLESALFCPPEQSNPPCHPERSAEQSSARSRRAEQSNPSCHPERSAEQSSARSRRAERSEQSEPPPCHPERSEQSERSRRARIFTNLLDFAQRTQLEKEALENLAIAGAFAPWFKSRREAMWALRALDEREARGELGKLMDVAEPAVNFKPIVPKQETAFDLWSTGITPKSQATAHFRVQLDAQRVIPAARLADMPNHLLCRVGGLVITRQRPGTAKGFVFLTLEDETGLVNVIVRPDVYERYRRTIRSASMLVIDGKLQKESGCIDMLAQQIHVFDGHGIADAIHAHNFR
ncbi:MAG TPA: OB-fold nucleic acid binding domain-containing protein, partial [Candidatus Tumulicola sp.]